MQKLSLLAQSYQELTRGGSFYPPTPIRLTSMKKPIRNRVKIDRSIKPLFILGKITPVILPI